MRTKLKLGEPTWPPDLLLSSKNKSETSSGELVRSLPYAAFQLSKGTQSSDDPGSPPS